MSEAAVPSSPASSTIDASCNHPPPKTAMPRDDPADMRILCGSPVRQTPDILVHFLGSLERLRHPRDRLGFVFVDDNTEESSSALLDGFARAHGAQVLPAIDDAAEPYVRDEITHRWTADLIRRVATAKDRIIDLALSQDWDALFLVDSDLVLHPDTRGNTDPSSLSEPRLR